MEYACSCTCSTGVPVPCQILYRQLQGILEDQTPPPTHQLGYLTTLNRDRWARVRQELEGQNGEELLAIDSAMLVLCLDDCEHVAPDTLFHAMLHNSGANRYVYVILAISGVLHY